MRKLLSHVSPRKIAANRQNALKSTGPRTPQGKEHSRRNSLKHGLFSRHLSDFLVLGEDPQEYKTLLNDFWDQYQPIGRAEELEVERIALCWWRRKRAWRYENAVCHIGVRDSARQQIACQEELLRKRQKEKADILLELRNAKNEIEHTRGTLPEDLKPRIFAIEPTFESIWTVFERIAQDDLKAVVTSDNLSEPSPEDYAWMVTLLTLGHAIDFIEMNECRGMGVLEKVVAQHLVPKRDEGERLLRYETSIERSLDRSLDRLERLQRRRQG